MKTCQLCGRPAEAGSQNYRGMTFCNDCIARIARQLADKKAAEAKATATTKRNAINNREVTNASTSVPHRQVAYKALRKVMHEKKIRQQDLADHFGLTDSSISNRFNAISPFKISEAYETLDFLGLPNEDFTFYFPKNVYADVSQEKAPRSYRRVMHAEFSGYKQMPKFNHENEDPKAEREEYKKQINSIIAALYELLSYENLKKVFADD